MSPNVGNFVSDLVEMAKATETLPIVQHELEQAKADNEALHSAVQAREEAIQRYKSEIETLQAKVRATEVERDDAEMRFLELDEKAHQVLGVLDLIAAKSGDAKAKLEPPKPEPIPEPAPAPVEAHETTDPVPSEPSSSGWNPNIEPAPMDPLSPITAGSGEGYGSGSPAQGDGSGGIPASPTPLPVNEWPKVKGQSEADPTSPSHATAPPTYQPSNASDTSSENAPAPATTEADPEPEKYMFPNSASTARTQAWWDWYDRQSFAFKQAYDWT